MAPYPCRSKASAGVATTYVGQSADGAYAILSAADERITVAQGQITVTPNLATFTGEYDGRSAAEIALADAESALANLTASGQRTREYYVDAQLNHLLTSTQTLSGGLRWTRATVFNLYPSSVNVARDFSWRLSYITNLSPRTTTTVGLRRQITHTPPSSTGSGDSNETTVGLRSEEHTSELQSH